MYILPKISDGLVRTELSHLYREFGEIFYLLSRRFTIMALFDIQIFNPDRLNLIMQKEDMRGLTVGQCENDDIEGHLTTAHVCKHQFPLTYCPLDLINAKPSISYSMP